jgi:hypothetical protein
VIRMHITHSLVEAFLGGPGVPNPAPMAPPGIQGSVSNIVAYVKWGVLLVIMLVGFIGAGAVAGGRIFSNHGSSKIGQGMIVSAVLGAILYAGIYAFLSSVTG